MSGGAGERVWGVRVEAVGDNLGSMWPLAGGRGRGWGGSGFRVLTQSTLWAAVASSRI